MRDKKAITITNTTSDLPIIVIKELKNGFKNYIPLSLCMHKVCSNVTKATDLFNMEIRLNKKGEIKLKQKTLMVVKDHYLMTDDFTEVQENFVWGMHRHLSLGDESEAGGAMYFHVLGFLQHNSSMTKFHPWLKFIQRLYYQNIYFIGWFLIKWYIPSVQDEKSDTIYAWTLEALDRCLDWYKGVW